VDFVDFESIEFFQHLNYTPCKVNLNVCHLRTRVDIVGVIWYELFARQVEGTSV